MNFITIEHKDGAITCKLDQVEYCFLADGKYHVVFKDLINRELTEEQYETLSASLVFEHR